MKMVPQGTIFIASMMLFSKRKAQYEVTKTGADFSAPGNALHSCFNVVYCNNQ